MSAPTCTQCSTTMECTGSIGYYCPSASRTAANVPQTVLRFHGGARTVRRLAICYYDALRPPSCCGQEMIWEVLRASYVCGICGNAR